MVHKLRQHDSEAFRQKLRTGVLEFLRTIRGWILANMRKHWKIDRLSVTMPAQWGREFQDVFLSLIGEAFEWNPRTTREKVGFVKAADALTRCLLSTPKYLDKVKAPNADQVWLAIDFSEDILVGTPVIMS